MASPSVRRKMSYRKPVPQYVPTPPGSPAPASLPPVELDLLQVTDDLLSLPTTWGQSQRPSESLPSHGLVPSMPFTRVPTAWTVINATDDPTKDGLLFVQGASSRECLSRGASTQGGETEETHDRSMTPDRKRRKLHREFRPPTPPLPAQHKRRRLTVTAYPEVETGQINSGHDNQPQKAIVSDDREREVPRSLRPTPSFTTERTCVSLGASGTHLMDTSLASGWSGGLTTFVSESDPRLSHYPLPLYNPTYTRKPFSELENEKAHNHAPLTWSGWLSDTLASCRAGLKSFIVVFCC